MVTMQLGSDHFYLVDPFNEMVPIASDLTYLEGVSRSIYGTLRKGDQQAICLCGCGVGGSQTGSNLVKQGKMLILDLTAEVFPQYGRLESYFGQPFIFCLLNNYGGVRGIFGNVNMLLKNLQDARLYPNSSLVGTGMTPEGIGSNYVIFDLMSEMSWRSHISNTQEWAVQYSRRRYGVQDEHLEGAWKLLMAVDADPPIDETAPSLDEVREAVAKLRGGKAAGVCKISAELLKAGREAMIRGLHAVLTAVWQSGTIPPDWKRGLVVPIWKGKGDRQDCNNYRSITLLSVPGKVLAHLLLMWIRNHLVKHQRPQQSGFTPGKSTTDRSLALRVLVERRHEFRQGMLAAYVDLKKAFDSVHRESLWDLLRLRGIPARTIGLMTGLYSGTESAVKCGAGVSSFFPVNTGMRLGCVLAPSLFNTCMDWVLGKVVDQSDCGASLGNTKITDLVFADDAVIFAESLEVLVMALEALHKEAKPLGLEVSWLQTKVQVFGGLLDETVQSVHACDVQVLPEVPEHSKSFLNTLGQPRDSLRNVGRGVVAVTEEDDGGVKTSLEQGAAGERRSKPAQGSAVTQGENSQRQRVQIAAVDMIKSLITNYRRGDIVALEVSSSQLQELINDLNSLLGSSSAYLLGSWIQSASNWSNDTQERSLLRRNSLYQISLWGPNGEILDYAVKQWNGVMQNDCLASSRSTHRDTPPCHPQALHHCGRLVPAPHSATVDVTSHGRHHLTSYRHNTSKDVTSRGRHHLVRPRVSFSGLGLSQPKHPGFPPNLSSSCLRSTYVAPRWGAFSEALLSAAKAGIAFDEAKFKASVFEGVEKPFSEDLDTFYPPTPIGDPVKLAVSMHEKYRPLFTHRKLMKQHMKLVMKNEQLT
ncbi:Alpha-N-acetylglucosaminidase [Chionoecetes opilio]|uniref:Alpha-N-acetylglucosaminidase n=1 Tax=Chionoecetes opilio TaxID=41210 RepID=A0A8J5D1V3_CHIOP|nr:Alpha-N-acetylglucosaminidase [Chionoecetes opilio]